jgi:hypothetical protein
MPERVEPPPPQVMAVKLDGHYFQLWDLPIEDVEAVAANHDGVFWLSVITTPLSSLSLARDIVEAVAKRMGKAVPLMTSAREVWNLFEQIPEDMPAEFADGIPKEVPDATETTGS